MPEPTIQSPGTFWEGIEFVVQARVVDKVQAIQTSINLGTDYALSIFDVSTRGLPTLVHQETQAAANVTFQDVAVGNGWDRDAVGWNVQLALDPASWTVTNAVGGKAYKFEFQVTAGTEIIPVDFRMTCSGRSGT